jgi:adenylate kinase
MDLVLFGIQGSGKGTQAKRLAKEFGYDIFEAGGELRGIAASGSPLGQTVKSYIDKGHLVPHEIIMRVVQEAIARRPKDQKILFDGIPRDADQKRDFDRIMREAGRDFRGIHLLLDPEEGIRRIFGRAKAEGRADDANEEIIRRRMGTFVEKTLPVIEEYKKQGKMVEADGKQDIEKVYAEMKKAVEGVH